MSLWLFPPPSHASGFFLQFLGWEAINCTSSDGSSFWSLDCCNVFLMVAASLVLQESSLEAQPGLFIQPSWYFVSTQLPVSNPLMLQISKMTSAFYTEPQYRGIRVKDAEMKKNSAWLKQWDYQGDGDILDWWGWSQILEGFHATMWNSDLVDLQGIAIIGEAEWGKVDGVEHGETESRKNSWRLSQ